MHRARCGLLFSATALPLGVAAAPNFFPCTSDKRRWNELTTATIVGRELENPATGHGQGPNSRVRSRFVSFDIP